MIISSKQRKLLGGFVALLVVVGGVVVSGARSGGKPMDMAAPAAATLEFLPTQLTTLQQHRLDHELMLPGTVQPLSQAVVRAKLAGVVLQVLVREGDSVAAGEVLARFDVAPLEAQLAERDALLASAKANLNQAQRTRAANAQLVARNFIAQAAFDAADASFQAQRASVQAAEAQLAQVRLQLADAAVRAPIDGVVARRYVQSGEKVGMDAQLLSIVNLSRLEVQAQAAVADVARVAAGTPAEVLIDGLAGQTFPGRVERINPSADPGSRSIDLYIAFPNERKLVRTGMFANVRLRLAAEGATSTLPLTAIQTEAGQNIVWAVRDGHLARHVVAVGRRDERLQLAEILAGVAPTDQVLATRFDNLKDGASARVAGAASAASAVAAH